MRSHCVDRAQAPMILTFLGRSCLSQQFFFEKKRLIVGYEDDDDDHSEEDVDWCTGNCDGELDETAYTAGTPTDDPELLEQFDGNLEDAHASASQVYASASRRST